MLTFAKNPPILSPEVLSPRELHGTWRVAHTKARFEKAFASDLRSRGVAYFLPLIERITFSGGRKRRTLFPLFPSYVFFCGSEEDRYRALSTDRLCQVIEVGDQDEFISEISDLHKAIGINPRLDLYPVAIVGQKYRIAGGSFEGLEGVVVRVNGSTRIVLQVGILGQGASMEIDAELLEPADCDDDIAA